MARDADTTRRLAGSSHEIRAQRSPYAARFGVGAAHDGVCRDVESWDDPESNTFIGHVVAEIARVIGASA
jgi:hypothetical protein